MASTVAILGAGVSGLTAAYRLQQRGWRVTVFEATDHFGGMLHTVRRDGFLLDLGANSTQTKPPRLVQVLDELGLHEAKCEAAPTAQHRYIVRDGRPVRVPMGPGAFLTTPLLSARAKWRLLREPFVPARDEEMPESIAAFVRRRLGGEVLDYAVDPLIGGIYAGQPDQISLRHAFPMLYDLEQTHGSLLRGALQRRKARKADPQAAPRPRLATFSFHDGMQTLPDALAAAITATDPVALRRQTPVRALSQDAEGWHVITAPGGTRFDERFDAVVCTIPLHRFADLDFGTVGDRARLSAVPYPAVTVMGLGFRRADIAHPLDGFGVLVPSKEPFRVLGVLFSSSVFPNRAPEGHVLLTCFIGGTRRPDLGDAPEDVLLEIVRADLRTLLGATGEPVFVHAHRWPHAIPQYALDHGEALTLLGALESAHPGLVFAGNYLHGLSVGDALAAGYEAADRLGMGT